MLEILKERCGIAESIEVYDNDISLYIEDAIEDMVASGVKREVIESKHPGAITAITFYVKANLGDDRSDTDKYMKLYREKVFRLTFIGGE